MNELIQTFNFHTHEVRTAIHENGEPYFCLSDVLPILGLESRAISKFNLDIKGWKNLPPLRAAECRKLRLFLNPTFIV